MLTDYNKRHARIVTMMLLAWMLLFVTTGMLIAKVLKGWLCC